MEKPWGEFCEVFGITPRNRVMEHFLTMSSLDFSIGDIAIETKLNRATTYNVISELIEGNYLVATRKVSGAQLFKLNIENKEVKILLKAMNLVIDKIFNEEEKKILVKN